MPILHCPAAGSLLHPFPTIPPPPLLAPLSPLKIPALPVYWCIASMKVRFPSRHRSHAVNVALGAFMATSLFAADMSPEQRAFFESKIRPVLVKQCYECHSIGAKKIGGKLLLDSPGEMAEGGESGPAVI